MEFRPRRALAVLSEGDVRFVVVGGIAAAMLGSMRETTDLDVIVESSEDNLTRLAAVLTQLGARVKGSTRPPMTITSSLLQGMTLVTFETDAGEVDVLMVGKGGWTYDQVIDGAEVVDVAGQPVRLISVEDLIAMKRAAGRPKDMETAAELEALKGLQERG
jgi:predicted nucleotidyltransferase